MAQKLVACWKGEQENNSWNCGKRAKVSVSALVFNGNWHWSQPRWYNTSLCFSDVEAGGCSLLFSGAFRFLPLWWFQLHFIVPYKPSVTNFSLLLQRPFFFDSLPFMIMKYFTFPLKFYKFSIACKMCSSFKR